MVRLWLWLVIVIVFVTNINTVTDKVKVRIMAQGCDKGWSSMVRVKSWGWDQGQKHETYDPHSNPNPNPNLKPNSCWLRRKITNGVGYDYSQDKGYGTGERARV